MRQHRRFQLPNSTNSTQTERFLRANAANSMQYKKFQRQNAANSMQHGRFSSKMLQITRKMKGSSSKMLQIACTWKGNGRIDAGDGKQNRSGKKIPGAGEKTRRDSAPVVKDSQKISSGLWWICLGMCRNELSLWRRSRPRMRTRMSVSRAHAHAGLACARAVLARLFFLALVHEMTSRRLPTGIVPGSFGGSPVHAVACLHGSLQM